MTPQQELELLAHKHQALLELWNRLMDALHMSGAGIFDWVDEC